MVPTLISYSNKYTNGAHYELRFHLSSKISAGFDRSIGAVRTCCCDLSEILTATISGHKDITGPGQTIFISFEITPLIKICHVCESIIIRDQTYRQEDTITN